MLVSHESPISILEESLFYNDYDYALVHLFETHPEYYDFFKKSLLNGRSVLLDNSIFELGESFDSEKYAKYIEELKPTFYIVPDVLEDGYTTCVKYNEFVKKYPNLPGIKIGVVQGKTFDELVDCYKYLSDHADYIAISFDYSYYIASGLGKTELERYCTGRERFIRDLINEGVWNFRKPHHLLGCSLAKEFGNYSDIKNIRSVDTSNPVVAGIKGLRYSCNFGLNTKPTIKLADLIDHEVTEDELDNIWFNVQNFKGIIGRQGL